MIKPLFFTRILKHGAKEKDEAWKKNTSKESMSVPTKCLKRNSSYDLLGTPQFKVIQGQVEDKKVHLKTSKQLSCCFLLVFCIPNQPAKK